MPTTKVKSPDGEIISVKHPAGASQEEIIAYAKENYSVASPTAKGTIADSLGQGVSFGFSDELAGVLGAIVGTFDDDLEGTTFGERYAGVRDAARANESAFAERNPGTALGAELVGGLATGGLGAARAGAARVAGSVPRLMGTGAGVGGAAGAGYSEGETIGEVAADTATGATIGAVGGAVAPPLARAVGRGVTAPLRHLQASRANRPIRTIEQAIVRDDMTPELVAARLRKMPQGATVADAGGESLQTLARDVTVQPGRARNVAKSLFEGRRRLAPARIDTAVRTALNQQGEFSTARQMLQDQMRSASAPLYEAAYQRPMRMTPRLTALLERPSLRQAIKEGGILAREEGEVIGGHIQILDYAKRALDDKIGGLLRSGEKQKARALIGTKNALLDEMDRQVPVYGRARAAFAGPKSLEEALETGRRFMREDAEEIVELLSGMGESERQFFRMGAIRQIRDAVLSKSDTADAYKAIFNTPLKRQKVEALFPDRKSFARFERAMRSEAKMFETGTKVMANSNTANKLSGVADLATDPGTMVDVATGGPTMAAMNALKTWLRQNSSVIRNEQMRDDIARRLFSVDQREQQALLRQIGAPARVRSLNDIPLNIGGAIAGGELVPSLSN